MPKAGEKYQHYKGGKYVILALAIDSDTEKRVVVYQDAHAPDKIWTRNLFIFLEEVEWEGRRIPRFTKIY